MTKGEILAGLLMALFLTGCASSTAVPQATASAATKATATAKIISSSTPRPSITPTATVQLVQSSETWDELNQFRDVLYMNGRDISPNGEWILEDDSEISSIKNRIEKISLNHGDYSGYLLSYWSPNSASIASLVATGPKETGIQSIIISNIENNQAKSFIFRWSNRDSPGAVYWSNDSSKIALGFDKAGLWILDKKATWVAKFSLPDIYDVFWDSDVIFTTSENRLYSINLKTRHVEKLYTFNDKYSFINILGHEKNTNRLILTGYNNSSHSLHGDIDLLFFDLENKILSPKTVPIGSVSTIIPSIPLDYLAILVRPKHNTDFGAPEDFYIYNVKTQEITYYGKIDEVFGWYSNLNGFLLRNYDENKIQNLVFRP